MMRDFISRIRHARIEDLTIQIRPSHLLYGAVIGQVVTGNASWWWLVVMLPCIIGFVLVVPKRAPR